MTAPQRKLVEVAAGWSWPIDVRMYDRTRTLNANEQWQLERLIHEFDKSNMHWPPGSKEALHHLLKPLNDVLDVTHALTRTRSGSITLILREMIRQQTTFWAWPREVWVALISYNAATFRTEWRRPADFRPNLAVMAYLLGDVIDLHLDCKINQPALARRIFGENVIQTAVGQISNELLKWGHGKYRIEKHIEPAVCALFLLNRSPRLEDLTPEKLLAVRQSPLAAYLKRTFVVISQALTNLGIFHKPLPLNNKPGERFGNHDAVADVPLEWLEWCQRWCNTSTLAPRTRKSTYYQLLKAGRWLKAVHPDIVSPEDWSRELAAEFVAVVDRMKVGEWAQAEKMHSSKLGKPMTPRAKDWQLGAMRIFFRDCQEWEFIPRRFDPGRCFATPHAIRALIAPNPRTIDDDIWAKLLWAGLNLTEDDLPAHHYKTEAGETRRQTWYPLEMVRAVVIVWLFAGLRSDEIVRLRVGCIHWQHEDMVISDTDEILPQKPVCFLHVPTHKTGTAFSKPVDRVVGEAVHTWEQVRPTQPAALDSKTAEMVDYLFMYRGKCMGKPYLNHSLIPMLCRKAGVPERDGRGNITSHRARSTIASQLFNARDPMSLFELQAWLGHRSPDSTQHYAKLTPTKLAKSYQDAGYFTRNVRTVEVLIDQQAILNGEAAQGLPWKYYDLGHGYCTYDFFEQCEHRMACAQCSFYRPKEGFLELLLEKKDHLLHMKQDIPLTDLELAAVEGDLAATERLITQLADRPTPAGPTPRQFHESRVAQEPDEMIACQAAHPTPVFPAPGLSSPQAGSIAQGRAASVLEGAGVARREQPPPKPMEHP